MSSGDTGATGGAGGSGSPDRPGGGGPTGSADGPKPGNITSPSDPVVSGPAGASPAHDALSSTGPEGGSITNQRVSRSVSSQAPSTGASPSGGSAANQALRGTNATVEDAMESLDDSGEPE